MMKLAQMVVGAGLALVVLSACGQGADEATAQHTSGDAALHPLDIIQGDEDAPVTIVEYASAGCGACGQFHTTVYPELVETYIETGKARYIMRELPAGDPVLFTSGALLARCVPGDKYYAVIDQLFRQQGDLYAARQTGELREAYLRIARRASLSEAAFDACMNDEELLTQIYDRAEADQATYGIRGTPSFLINGELARGVRTLEDFADIIDPLLNAASGE